MNSRPTLLPPMQNNSFLPQTCFVILPIPLPHFFFLLFLQVGKHLHCAKNLDPGEEGWFLLERRRRRPHGEAEVYKVVWEKKFCTSRRFFRLLTCTEGTLLQNPRILGEYSIFQGRPFKNVPRIKDLLPPLGLKRPPWLHASWIYSKPSLY